MEKEHFVKIPKWVARNSQISPIAKALYMAIKSYNPSFPSYSRLCKDTGINSHTTIRKYLIELVHLNLITIQKSGFNRSNTYLIVNSPFNGVTSQKMKVTSSDFEVNPLHNLESIKNNIKISNKDLKNSLDSDSNEKNPEQIKSLSNDETNMALSDILKSIS